jgi:hypothetical protein
MIAFDVVVVVDDDDEDKDDNENGVDGDEDCPMILSLSHCLPIK